MAKAKKQKQTEVATESQQTETAKLPKSDKGIVLIAHGHPMYAHYAYNMAVSLKFVSPEIPIAVITSGGCLNMLEEEQRQIFDTVIDAKPYWITDNKGTNYLLNKLYLDEATPYSKTLYLDVDMVWNPRRKVSELFDLCNGVSFQPCATKMIHTATHITSPGDWMDYDQLLTHYKLEKLVDLSSEVMYFETTEVFKQARIVFYDGFLTMRPFAGALPDEPFLMAGLALSGEQLRLNPWTPTYWQNRYFNKFKKDEDIFNEYYAISAGGNLNAINTERMYNVITSSAFNGMGIDRTPYKLQHKRNVLKRERATI